MANQLAPELDNPLPDDGAFPAREYRRAPKDDRAYEGDGACGKCFACSYDESGGVHGSNNNILDMSAAQDGHGDVMKLIRQNYGSTSLKELVNMVYDHYEKHVRPWVDHGSWSKRCIAEHITVHMADDDIQINEGITTLYAQIESLRDCCWYIEDGSDSPMPDHKNIKLLHDLVKTSAALIESRKKRR